MAHRIACLLVMALAIVTGPTTDISAHAVPQTAIVEILVGGAPQHRYAHNGRWYVEALKGQEYSIRLRNPYGVRVAVALSVDGLNTLDGRETSAADARKWVLEPYQTVDIGGWQTSRSEARRFEFTTEERSYGQSLGKTANFGIISAVFFRERVRDSSHDARQGLPAPPAPASAAPERSDAAKRQAENEYAATEMGRRTSHEVTTVWMDLESTAAQTVNIRYEFRPQLVRLGVVRDPRPTDTLERRERARGFEPGFCPVPKSR
jgi:hypothetical protein